MIEYYDVKPYSAVASIPEDRTDNVYDLADVLPVLGMSESFVRKVIGNQKKVSESMVVELLEQDAFSETFVPRSKILAYLRRNHTASQKSQRIEPDCLYHGDALELIDCLDNESVACVVTSTPYWAMRIYDEMVEREWADGEVCSFGLEQTPEGFIRHSVEILFHLYPKITENGSVWWNIMDSYNTRTQIRSNAVEALQAMKGLEKNMEGSSI